MAESTSRKVVLAYWRTWIVSIVVIIGSWAYWMFSDGVGGKGGVVHGTDPHIAETFAFFFLLLLTKVIIILRAP